MTEPNERSLSPNAAEPAGSHVMSGSEGESKQAAPAADASYRPSYLFLAAVSGLTVISDLTTKYWALHRLEKDGIPTPIEVIPDKLAFVLARNRGGAWGLLQSSPEAIRKPFFLLVSCVAIVFIVSLFRRLAPGQRALRWGLPLVLGGAIGNLVDRVRYSWVVDFIDVHIVSGGRAYHWPTFNIADIAICIGVGLMAVDMIGSHKKHADSSKPLAPPAASEPPAETP